METVRPGGSIPFDAFVWDRSDGDRQLAGTTLWARDELVPPNGEVRFGSRRRHPGARPVRFDGSYRPVGEEFLAEPDSLERFLVDRVRYFTEAQDGSIRHAIVDHERWPLYRVQASVDAAELFAANGFAVPDADPAFLYSPGVDTVASPSTLS